jgi:hypothetical protein
MQLHSTLEGNYLNVTHPEWMLQNPDNIANKSLKQVIRAVE